jgi:hypothetical protein
VTDRELTAKLQCELQSSSRKSASYTARKQNIDWIRKLPFKGCRYGGAVRRTLIARTQSGERLYIEYPGKESVRQGDKCRPYDFFPVLRLPGGRQWKDLGFNDIFGAVYDELRARPRAALPSARMLAAVVYRMAFMLDHVPADLEQCGTVTLLENGSAEKWSGKLPQGVLVYSPPKEVIAELTCAFPKVAGLSLEGFLRYCDILAWNEDSKYYYSKVEQGGSSWMNSTGRVNTLLTVVRVIGLATEDVHLGDLLGGFSYGTSAAGKEEVVAISGGLVSRPSD